MAKRWKFDLDVIYSKITSEQDCRMETSAWKAFLLAGHDDFFHNGVHWKASAKSLGAGVYSVTAKQFYA